MSKAQQAAPPVGLGTKLFYGLGSVAYGIKDNGFQTFVLLFYNQLVGLPASWVGEAVFLALVIDAVMDPIVGQVSDHWRSRWGRRHPFMYLSALPVAVSYLALWNPPHWSHPALFAYLVVVAVVVRTFITFYEIPSSALSAELTGDYDARTSILGFRYLFGWLGGLGMTFLAYAAFLRPTAHYPVGQLNPVGYAHYGVVSALLMFLTIMVSAAGTHRRIPYLRAPPRRESRSLGQLAREMAATLSHRSFLVVLTAGLFGAMAQGLYFALALYLSTFVWELTSTQILILIVQGFLGAIVAMTLAPILSRRFGKKTTAMGALACSIVTGGLPLSLRLLGLFPANHTPALLPSLMAFGVVGSSLSISASILTASMIADVVDDSELKTGRRSEGLFFAASSFVQKAVSGAGLLLSGLMLSLARFPVGAHPGHVPQGVLTRLVLTYLLSSASLYLVALAFLSFYQIDRRTHEDNLERLKRRAEEDAEAPEHGRLQPN